VDSLIPLGVLPKNEPPQKIQEFNLKQEKTMANPERSTQKDKSSNKSQQRVLSRKGFKGSIKRIADQAWVAAQPELDNAWEEIRKSLDIAMDDIREGVDKALMYVLKGVDSAKDSIIKTGSSSAGNSSSSSGNNRQGRMEQ
jgi:hypothetical protein